MERQAARRSSVGAVITTFLSLLVVAAAVAVVAYFVLRAPSSAVDSAERLEPVGTALPAPTEPPTLPTPIPTAPPEPTALGFTGEQPVNTELPTVPAPTEAPAEQTGPTPTPRVLALPTEVPATVPPPPPTLPPSAPPTNVPVVALAPVEAAPPPTAAPQQVTLQPAPTPTPDNADPLNVFGENEPPRIVPSGNDARDRVRAIQDDINGNINQRRGRNNAGNDSQDVVPVAVAPTIVAGNGGSVEIVVPDVDAMIDEITARTTDPNRNPNIGSAGRAIQDRGTNSDRDDNSGRNDNNKKKKPNSRGNRRPTTVVVPVAPSIQPGNTGNQGNQGDCPFSNLPEDQRPKDWPFGDCS